MTIESNIAECGMESVIWSVEHALGPNKPP